MGRLKTNEEFLNDLNNKYGNEYIPLSNKLILEV